jgi:hypothetical protein
MSIMDFFRPQVPAVPQSQESQQPGVTPPTATTTQTGGTAPGNPTLPAGATPPTPGTPNIGSPLDQYADLWKTDPNAAPTGNPANLFNVDPAKLQEAASKTDFTHVVTPELRQKLQAGGDDAMSATLEVINKVAQANFAQSALATTKIVEQALTKYQEANDARISGMIKQQTVSENLRGENPIFNNPAISPLVSAMEQQLTSKFPGASAAEITKMAKDYIAGVATAFTPTPAASSTKEADAGDTYDWSNFLK